MLSVQDFLALPEVQRGRPQVLAGDSCLGNRIRWVHVSELPDIAYCLRGEELILSTGIALQTGRQDLERYVKELATAPVSGLVIELGRKFSALPPELVNASQRRSLPLIALRREVPFVPITEAVHSMIVDGQLQQLKHFETIHRRFMELSVEGADADRILILMRELTRRGVVLENLAHQALAYVSAEDATEHPLVDWERRSRALRSENRTQFIAEEGESGDSWLVTMVGARGQQWGRLLMQLDGEPSALETMVLERGSAALSLNRLEEREQDTLERQTHRTLIEDIRSGGYSSAAELSLHAEALGIRLRGRRLISAVARIALDERQGGRIAVEARLRDVADTIATALREIDVPAIVGVMARCDIGIIVSLSPDQDIHAALDDLARNVHRRVATSGPTPEVTLGVGSIVDEVRDLRRSFNEAEQVVNATAGLLDNDKLYYELPDIRIRGLLFLLREDSRLQTFVERELAPILMHDGAHDGDLIRTLHLYLTHGRNKTAAAEALGMSRPALYHRLGRIERMLDVNLDSVEPCLSLHVALLALEALRHETML